jgi:hypothetical protein
MNIEFIGCCGVCHKECTRDKLNEFRYYNGEFYCRGHDGVEEWYGGALKILSVKLKMLEGE